MEIYGSELAVHFPTSGLTTHSLTCKQSFHIKVVFTRITRPRKVVLKYHINVLFISERSELSVAGLAPGGVSASSNKRAGFRKVDYCKRTFIISKQLANKREGSSDEKHSSLRSHLRKPSAGISCSQRGENGPHLNDFHLEFLVSMIMRCIVVIYFTSFQLFLMRVF